MRFCILVLASLHTAPLLAQVPAAAQVGKRLFEMSCSTGYCHGLDGRAGRGPRLRDRTWTKRYLYNTIENGIPGSSMPAWQGRLSASNIHDIISYLLTISKEQPEAEHSDTGKSAATSHAAVGEASVLGKALFFDPERDRNCGVCHRVGNAGGSLAPRFGKLSLITDRELIHQIIDLPERSSNLQIRTKDGEVICGVKAQSNGSSLQIYDLDTEGPPVLRTVEIDSLWTEQPCTTLNVHQANRRSYTPEEVKEIVAFLRSTLQ